MDKVAVRPFAVRAVELHNHHGVSWSDMARRGGFKPRKDGYQDVMRFKRLLGLSPQLKNSKPYFTTHVSYENAIKLCRALDVLPIDMGL